MVEINAMSRHEDESRSEELRAGSDVAARCALDEEGVEFDTFVAARGDALWRTAWLLTGDAHRAEDLVQTALGKTWQRWNRIARPGAAEAYVRRVMFTTYVAWWRRKWNSEIPTESSMLPDLADDAGAERVALQRDMVAALVGLPRGQRAVVVLRYVEDLSETQTAELLGISIGTVKSQAARGLAALRRSPALTEEAES